MIAVLGRILLFLVLLALALKLLFGRGKKRQARGRPQIEEMKKDPVCGTFVPASQAVSRRIKGETYFFCSAECRDRFSGT